MIFKASWERTPQTVPEAIIPEIVKKVYPEKTLSGHQFLSGGCANINIKLDLLEEHSPLILRLYLRDPKAALREQNLSKLLSSEIPVPHFHQISQWEGYTFAITEYLPGITLRDFFLQESGHQLEPISNQAGALLAKIASNTFDQGGFFNENLTISEPAKDEDCLFFAEKCLKDKVVLSVLSKEELKKIAQLLKTHETLLPDSRDKNLVHGDFDPSNILVKEIDGAWKISGILDWEFSFSGSPLWDIANMLRYANEMPQVYRNGFLSGLTFGGFKLPENWEIKIHIFNLLSLLDCLKRSNPQNEPNRVSDINKLIQEICSELKK